MPDDISWPEKTREMQNNHMDSTFWNEFAFRDDDIIISTWAKAGTTWVQQILSQLIFNAEEGLPVADMSPWIDLRVPPKEVKIPEVEAQTHRRFIKTHLPVDALVFSPEAKYIYIGRDGRDVVWSLYNHHINANDFWYEALNETPGRVGPPMGKPVDTIEQYYHDWLDKDGFPFWSFWENVRTWWEIQHLPNVKLIHFSALKEDMAGEIRSIADFIDQPIDESNWEKILHHCSFDYMKENATTSVPLGGAFWDGGAETFVHKGTNGRWKDVLSEEDCAKYETMAVNELGEDCAHWLKTGSFL
ncbi:MAG: sulfotransferase domain-containing protein [Rhodospirillaceae bacterium]|jgi:aryl sulfotransferase|nr:sulfotransferase domain-containing protein [Rhodospirillaceae bacterium]MBT4589802.1 sulfotransferase domain-containing protein [Rhodospirillaceae bacterium]MBT4938859.1 sulfotransferase domain-containing protein [Rhodospirillaceae bacterium]MBT5938417.1 sulfotransferase domain-containing protein [Rhodospirillaceae bacterium]MBT7268195.1 sulfotransferase domain-containing protein [Rhodospirillaceae bacterium]